MIGYSNLEETAPAVVMANQSDESSAIALLGVTRNTDNYGVRVLMTAAIEALAEAFPQAEMLVLDYGYAPETWTEMTQAGPRRLRLINLRFSWRVYLPNNVFRLVTTVLFTRMMPERLRLWVWRRNDYLREISKVQAFSIAGGDSFSDIYGLPRLLYVALPQLLVLLMQRPLALLPQTYGPFDGAIARRIARYILRKAKLVFSRDEKGADAVRGLIKPDDKMVRVVPDIGFAMTSEELPIAAAESLSEIRREGPVIGLNVSSLLYMGGYTRDNAFGLRDDFSTLIEALVRHMVSELGAQVLLVPHVCGGPGSEEDEGRLCRKLKEKFRAKYGGSVHCVDVDLNHREMKAVIGQCDTFMGARMHACIAAASQGVPTICLAYSKKFAGVMQPLGAGVRVLDLRVEGIDEILQITGQVFKNRVELRQGLRIGAEELRRRIDDEFIANLS